MRAYAGFSFDDWAESGSNGEFELAIPSVQDIELLRGMKNVKDSMVTLRAESRDGKLGVLRQFDRSTVLKPNFTLKLEPAKSLNVLVTDNSGKPVKSAYVRLFAKSDIFSDSYFPPVKTNAKGIARINGIYEGCKYTLSVSKSGYYWPKCWSDKGAAALTLPFAESKSWSSTVKAVLEPANQVLRGRVVSEKGEPAAYAIVFASEWIGAATNTKGEFVLRNLPKRKLSLKATKYEYEGSATVVPGSGDVTITVKSPHSKH
jgi:hypothetical protein